MHFRFLIGSFEILGIAFEESNAEMAVGEAASFDAGPVALHAGHKSSLHKKTLCMWGLLGTLFTVGIVCNSITTTRGPPHDESAQSGSFLQGRSMPLIATEKKNAARVRKHSVQFTACYCVLRAEHFSPLCEAKTRVSAGFFSVGVLMTRNNGLPH